MATDEVKVRLRVELATVTEREAVLRERAAYEAGIYRAHADHLACHSRHADAGVYRWMDDVRMGYLSGDAVVPAASKAYPLPVVTRPRVVTVPSKDWGAREFRYIDGSLQSRTIGRGDNGAGYPWTPCAQITPNAQNIAALADLLANPTEEVPE